MKNQQGIRSGLTIGVLFLLAASSMFLERQVLTAILERIIDDPSSEHDAQQAASTRHRSELKFALRPNEYFFRRENASMINWTKTDDDHHFNPSTPEASTATEGSQINTSNNHVDDTTMVWNHQVWKTVRNSNSVSVDGQVSAEIVNGKLIVNVDHTYMFWNNGQTKLCDLLHNMTLENSWEMPRNYTVNLKRPLLNATMDCREMVKHEGFGQGNWVTALYCVRVAAAKAQVDFQFQCSDGRHSQDSLLLPWFEGNFPAPNFSNPWPYSGTLPTEDEACTPKYPKIRVDKMADQITDQVRKLAVTVVGPRDSIRRHSAVPPEQPPLVPDVVLDDVAIHFRCGDVMGGARRSDFGMIKFTEYLRWISPEARSIGILTQPFDPSRNRLVDKRRVGRCRNATFLLVDVLQQSFPQTRITIHNGPNETLPLAYARLVMANQSFTTLSSFGIFPVIGTFGHGYFQRGNRGVNPFANYLPQFMPNLQMMTAPVITMGEMSSMNLTTILEWLSTPDANLWK
eukprot:scaffold5395_cov126-Cylindrotheca_fusiformis.AAC.4